MDKPVGKRSWLQKAVMSMLACREARASSILPSPEAQQLPTTIKIVGGY